MNFEATLAVRDRLMTDAALSAFFISRYEKPCRHLVGYKRTPGANDYPYLSYVGVRKKKAGLKNEQLVSIVLGLIEKDVDTGIFDGAEQSSIALRLIEAVLVPVDLAAGFVLSSESVITSDMGARQPIYEHELQVVVKWAEPMVMGRGIR